jgi:hypothetical protein
MKIIKIYSCGSCPFMILDYPILKCNLKGNEGAQVKIGAIHDKCHLEEGKEARWRWPL